MKRTLFIFAIVAALAVTSSASLALSLAEMRQSPFGSTILSAVQLNAAAGYDASPIINVVQEIVSQLHDSQSQADNRNSTNQGRCDSNVSQFNRQITETTATIASLHSSIEHNQHSLESDTDSLAQAVRDFDNTSANIENGIKERQDSHARWADSDSEVTEALKAIDDATQLIQHLVHGVSFAQVKVRYDRVVERLSANKSKHAALFKPLVLALSQLSAKLNLESVQKILNLLQNLRQALADSKAEAQNGETTSANLWEKLLEQLQNNKQHYSELKQQYTISTQTLRDLLAQQKTSLENNENSLENFQLQLADEEALCQKQSNEYAQESKENAKETDILNGLVKHLEENFSAFIELM